MLILLLLPVGCELITGGHTARLRYDDAFVRQTFVIFLFLGLAAAVLLMTACVWHLAQSEISANVESTKVQQTSRHVDPQIAVGNPHNDAHGFRAFCCQKLFRMRTCVTHWRSSLVSGMCGQNM